MRPTSPHLRPRAGMNRPSTQSSSVPLLQWWLTERRVEVGDSWEDVAAMTGATVEDLQSWAQGNGQPSARQLLSLARRLRDPSHPPGADPLPGEPVEEGRFVMARSNELGIGKCVGLDGETATVEYFDSVARRVERTVDVEDLVTVRLAHQTRCYVFDEEADRWRMGRVSRLKDGDRIIELPDQESTDVPQENLYVRWARPVDDPIETLKVKGQETVFFRNQRGPFVRALLDQRSAVRGMDGLLSSSIPMRAHQVETVRQMLRRPTPRYLLSDETGQGPSRPAAVVLRQLLLDAGDAEALVLVPEDAVETWTTVLDRSFDIFSVDGTVDVRAFGGDWMEAEPDILLVDAAHRTTAWRDADADRFDALERASHGADGLLLLADAAVHRHVSETATLLHLLDPDAAPDEDALRERVAQRAEIGEALQHLDRLAGGNGAATNAETTGEDAEDAEMSLDGVLGRIADAAPDDEDLEDRIDDDAARLSDEALDPEERDGILRELRLYLRERFRLHPRAFRLRRSDAESHVGSLRAPEADARLVDYGLDLREETVHALLATWRERAGATASDETAEAGYAETFRHLVETAGADLDLFADLIRLRRDGNASDRVEADFAPTEREAVTTPAKLDDEEALLEDLIEAAEAEVDEFDFTHGQWLEQYIDLNVDAVDACVVYASRPSVARRLQERLAGTFGADAVAANLTDDPPDQIDEEIRRFREDAECRILVGDRSAERGPALPFATHVVHYDLPWNPVRIERRIQRVAPVGERDEALQTNVYLGPDLGEEAPSLFETWMEVLRDGFRIFQSPIAGREDAAAAIGDDALRHLFREGATDAVVDEARSAMDRARADHDRQHVFEAIDVASEDAQRYIDDVTSLEERSQDLYNRMDSWITKALQFHRSKREYPDGVIKYEPQYDGRTLVPFDVILNRFLPQSEKPTTYHRSCAVQPEGGIPAVTMFRIGHPFLRALADYFSWDDRGRTYALWRESQPWAVAGQDDQLFFRFDFVVEADPEPVREVLSESTDRAEALQHRLYDYLPPSFETVFVNREGEPVTQDGLLKLLEAEPQRKSKGGPDRNVKGERLPVLDEFIPPTDWARRCQQARNAAASALREYGDLQARSEAAQEQVAADAEAARRRIRARAGTSETAEQDIERQDRLHDALRAGVQDPTVRLDSVGVVILSGDPLPVDEEEE